MKHPSRLFICLTLIIAFSPLDSVSGALILQDEPLLEFNKPVEREITSDEVHAYRIRLTADGPSARLPLTIGTPARARPGRWAVNYSARARAGS